MRLSWRTAAIAAIALNLLLIGLFAGLTLGGGRIGEDRGHVRREGPGAAAQLPPAARVELRRASIAAVRASQAERREARAAREALVETVRREPYDPAAVKAAFARMRAADAAALQPLHDAMADALASLPPEQRAPALRLMARRHQAGPNEGGPRPQGAPPQP